MDAPRQVNCTKLADYLEVLTKPVFEGGMSWQIVEAKWPGFQEAFHHFDPARVADLTPDEIDALSSDSRIIRNRRKIESTVHNARAMIDVEREFGSFKVFLDQLAAEGGFPAQVRGLRKRFKHIGDFGAYYFLYVIGEPVPDHHEYREKLLEGAKG
jgi:3-methyladenine DNA glycosylase Tag